MTTLKVLKLVDEDGRPREELGLLVFSEGEERRSVLRQVLRGFYGPVFELDLARATRGQFHEAFRRFGAREGVLTKCEAFFIKAARDADVELSQYILAGRHGARRSASSRSQRPAPQGERSVHLPAELEPAPVHPQLSVAEKILQKYPDFDPSWAPEVQSSWLSGMARLYGALLGPGDSEEARE